MLPLVFHYTDTKLPGTRYQSTGIVGFSPLTNAQRQSFFKLAKTRVIKKAPLLSKMIAQRSLLFRTFGCHNRMDKETSDLLSSLCLHTRVQEFKTPSVFTCSGGVNLSLLVVT